MSKIKKAIYEIEHLSQAAEKDQWMNRIHPLVKLFLTIFYIFVVVSFPKYELTGVISMAIYPIVIFIVGELSFRDAMHRLKVVLPVVCIMGIFNPFFDRAIVSQIQMPGTIGIINVTGGVISMFSLMCKGVLTVLASYILVVTTSIEKICYALRLLHVPKIVVTQILLIYRYINVLLAEAHRITQAYELRAPGQKGVHFKAWGSLVGQMLLRSMDRADTVYASMCLRGYTGEFTYSSKESFAVKDMIFLIIWTIIIIVFRLFPIFSLVGNMMI